ncbi:MAG: helix-turn-helix domain-containing protein [Halieaceae bacterium]
MKRVIAALYPRTLATSLALPMDVLQAAGQAASSLERGQPQLQFKLAAPSLEPVELVGGMRVTPDMTLDTLEDCDMLLLPALWRNPQPVLQRQQAWLEVLPQLAAAGTTICSVGTASCFLAACGLLDQRAATTHWNYFDEFAARYPQVQLKRRHLITQSDNLYCAGSVNSGADLMIHLVEDWFGQRIARAIESQFSPEIRRPFRAHAYQSVDDSAHHDELVLTAQEVLQDQLHQPISIEQLATDLRCSPRTLTRRFKSATGQTPSAYLRGQRLAAARELLRATNLSVGEVAWQVGLQDVSYFTSLFQKHVGQTPGRYRNSVRGKLFNSAGQ